MYTSAESEERQHDSDEGKPRSQVMLMAAGLQENYIMLDASIHDMMLAYVWRYDDTQDPVHQVVLSRPDGIAAGATAEWWRPQIHRQQK
jgi:hypothetical protein